MMKPLKHVVKAYKELVESRLSLMLNYDESCPALSDTTRKIIQNLCVSFVEWYRLMPDVPGSDLQGKYQYIERAQNTLLSQHYKIIYDVVITSPGSGFTTSPTVVI